MLVVQEQLQPNSTDGIEGGQFPSAVIDVHITTLEEEKRLLQQQLIQVQEKGRRDSEALKSRIDELDEKTRRKQDMLV